VFVNSTTLYPDQLDKITGLIQFMGDIHSTLRENLCDDDNSKEGSRLIYKESVEHILKIENRYVHGAHSLAKYDLGAKRLWRRLSVQ